MECTWRSFQTTFERNCVHSFSSREYQTLRQFFEANCISICCAARSSTAQPCDSSLNDFIRLGLGAVLRFGPTTPKSINPSWLRTIRLREASLGKENEI